MTPDSPNPSLTFDLLPGQRMDIGLREIASAGYRWTFETLPAGTVQVELGRSAAAGSSEQPRIEDRHVGGPGEAMLYITAGPEPGEDAFSLTLRRSFEAADAAPLKRMQVHARVRRP